MHQLQIRLPAHGSSSDHEKASITFFPLAVMRHFMRNVGVFYIIIVFNTVIVHCATIVVLYGTHTINVVSDSGTAIKLFTSIVFIAAVDAAAFSLLMCYNQDENTGRSKHFGRRKMHATLT